MNPVIGGALISGGANLLGGGLSFLGGSSANAANAAMAQQQMMMQQQQFNESMAFSKYALENAPYIDVRDRIQAAQQFGVSPLVALGAPSSSWSAPVGDISGGGGNAVNPFSGFERSMGNLGQDISRAMMATKTAEEKALVKAQTDSLLKDSAVKDAHTEALRAQANFYNARALETPHYPSLNPKLKPTDDQKSLSDEAYKTNRGTMEYQATPGTAAASGSFFESLLNMARNRIDVRAGGIDHARVWSDVKRLFPGAVNYEMRGTEIYPIYPADEVKADVKREVDSTRKKPWFAIF